MKLKVSREAGFRQTLIPAGVTQPKNSRIILNACIRDIKQELRALNDHQKSEHQNQRKIPLNFAEIIKFHSEAKQLSRMSERINLFERILYL